jgi:hypothetical protein
MKESKNNSILTKLKETDITKLKDDELNKTAKEIANTININGLRRHINYSLFQITTDESIDNNKKLDIIKSLLQGQKLIEVNVRNFRRKSIMATDKKDIITFITTTAEILTAISKYQPKKAKTKELKTVKELGETTEPKATTPVAEEKANKPTTTATTKTATKKETTTKAK